MYNITTRLTFHIQIQLKALKSLKKNLSEKLDQENSNMGIKTQIRKDLNFQSHDSQTFKMQNQTQNPTNPK